MRSIPAEAEAFIKKHEKLVLRVYDDKHPSKVLKPGDPVEGVLTGGWGHTGGLKIGQPVSREQAQKWFDSDATNKAIKPLYAKIGAIADELTDSQYGALISFVFNLGTGDPKKKEWTIWKRVRARQFDQVPIEMSKFVNWNGKKSQGLVNRRNAEIALWSKGEPGSTPVMPPSSVTRREATPPTPADPVPPQRSAVVLTAGAAAATGVPSLVDKGIGLIADHGPAAAKQAIEAVDPFADKSPVAQSIVSNLATVGAVIAVLVLVLVWLNKRKARG